MTFKKGEKKDYKTGKEPSIKLGDKFLLKCGVEVEVVEYNNWRDIIVKDELNNTKKTTGKSLVKGTTVWFVEGNKVKVYHVDPNKKYGLPKKYKVGTIHQTTSHGMFEIIYVDSEIVRVKFENTGHERVYPATNNFRPREVKDNSVKRTHKESVFIKRFPEGTVLSTNLCGKYEVLKVHNGRLATIKWQNTNHIQNVNPVLFNRGGLMDDSCTGNYLKAEGYYVYGAIHDGEIIYIGKGKGDRYSHVNSGTSNSLLLNKLYFEGEEVIPFIVRDNLTENEAYDLEELYLMILAPSANIKIPNFDNFQNLMEKYTFPELELEY